MSRTSPPYASLTVVALTASIFLYFSCSGSDADDGDSKGSYDVFGEDLEESAAPIDPGEAGLKPVLASGCGDVSDNSRFCEQQVPAKTIGKAD